MGGEARGRRRRGWEGRVPSVGGDSNNQQYPAEHQGHQGRVEKIVMTTASLTHKTILPASLMMNHKSSSFSP